MRVVPTSLTRTVAVGALTALAVAIGGPSYAGDGPKPNVGVTQTGSNTAGVQASQTTTQVTPGQSGSSGSSGYTGSSSSSGDPASAFPGVTDPAQQGACNPALYGADGYSYNLALPAPCIQPEQTDEPEGEAPPAPPQVTTEMVTAAARVVAPTSPPHVEPGTVSYVNIPNNYWTESPTVRDSVTVLGQVIPLVWTPTSTTWDFGDGGSATGDGVKGADVGAADAIEHSYARQGSYEISTTTTYNLTFMLPGQGAQTIALTATPSDPVTLPVREIQTLVDFTR
jgi:hypothetical protein